MISACRWTAIVFVSGITVAYADTGELKIDVADAALLSVSKTHANKLMCAGSIESRTLADMRAQLDPYIKGIDVTSQNSYKTLALAVYRAFPCPFSPEREELRKASKVDLLGQWKTDGASLKLRFGSQLPTQNQTAGVPPLTCEIVAFGSSGQYSVAEARGNLGCATAEQMMVAGGALRVQSWLMREDNRVYITRTDRPEEFQEWDVYTVKAPFIFDEVSFQNGDLLMYLRKHPGNNIGATSMFRHLKKAV